MIDLYDLPFYDLSEDVRAIFCRDCGWLRCRVFRLDGFYGDINDTCAVSKQISLDAVEAPISELQKALLNGTRRLRDLSAGKMEELVAAVFAEHFDCEIHYTSNGVFAPDGGIDFVLVRAEAGIAAAFQVKRRLTDRPESIIPVREFVGAVAMSTYNQCYFVTTAPQFARSLAGIRGPVDAMRRRSLELHLVSAPQLMDLMRETRTLNECQSSFKETFRHHRWVRLSRGDATTRARSWCTTTEMLKEALD
ncbi:MAG TPA: restriction endonuclease [Bryobacteraceae bacterium]|nr:restriction endonuclease [Bryobacteraceae bacterium]